jgi:hypothetical protein
VESLTPKQRYKKTPKGVIARQKYKKSVAGKAAAKRARDKRPKHYTRDAMRLYRQKPGVVEKERAYKQSLQGRKVSLRGYLRRTYGLTLEIYNAQLVLQDGHCALCARTPEQEPWGRLSVDHDHSKPQDSPLYFRGLLCNTHNVALGVLGDTEEALLKAIAYARGSARNR